MAGAQHGMCELTARHGRGTAWAWHAVYESALSFTEHVLKSPEISGYCAA